MVHSKRKSAEYYHEHKQTITEIRKLYDELYKKQPFSAGYMDRSLKYFVMEVTTDTVRYLYNSDRGRNQLYETITKFKYDTSKLVSIYSKMKEIECLWLSKSSFFIEGNREKVTYLSFKSASSGGPFKENKYYILIFLTRPFTSPEIKKRIKRGDIVKIDELVYFTIGNRFR